MKQNNGYLKMSLCSSQFTLVSLKIHFHFFFLRTYIIGHCVKGRQSCGRHAN